MTKRIYETTPTDRVYIKDVDNVWKLMDRGSANTAGGFKKPFNVSIKKDNNAWEEVYNECVCNSRGACTCEGRTAFAGCTCHVVTSVLCGTRTYLRTAHDNRRCNCVGRTAYCDCVSRNDGHCCCNDRGDYPDNLYCGMNNSSERGSNCPCNNRGFTCTCMEGERYPYNTCQDYIDRNIVDCGGCECNTRSSSCTTVNSASYPATTCTKYHICDCVSRGQI